MPLVEEFVVVLVYAVVIEALSQRITTHNYSAIFYHFLHIMATFKGIQTIQTDTIVFIIVETRIKFGF